MTRVSMWIARRPEDELADAIAAADRRKTMDALKVRHNVVVDDPAAPSAAAGACGWCATRHRLAAMSDGASRMPRFGRLMASAAGRRAVGEPCESCVRTALGVLKRRVDAGRRPKTPPVLRGTASTQHRPDGGATRASRYPRSTGGHTLTASATTPAAQHANCVICGGEPSQVPMHPPWFTSVLDHDRWVASGRPKRWPA